MLCIECGRTNLCWENTRFLASLEMTNKLAHRVNYEARFVPISPGFEPRLGRKSNFEIGSIQDALSGQLDRRSTAPGDSRFRIGVRGGMMQRGEQGSGNRQEKIFSPFFGGVRADGLIGEGRCKQSRDDQTVTVGNADGCLTISRASRKIVSDRYASNMGGK
jgi:hypothetical protein